MPSIFYIVNGRLVPDHEGYQNYPSGPQHGSDGPITTFDYPVPSGKIVGDYDLYNTNDLIPPAGQPRFGRQDTCTDLPKDPGDFNWLTNKKRYTPEELGRARSFQGMGQQEAIKTIQKMALEFTQNTLRAISESLRSEEIKGLES